ncbi:Plasmodium vivax Vir protein, putative [Plasmodium vivax]|uniref:Vir protein, putative n=1 Tax=Plasmodium vivax TaxID=5855 RepID=A0A1G4E674_PLAVI|nr:Plasmodium vivax Vir protein, putative [Plasmodium vivax]
MYENNFNELSTNNYGEQGRIEQCRYLIFWINDEITKWMNLTDMGSLDKALFLSGFNSVSDMLNRRLTENKCIYNCNDRKIMELWKKWKDVYDYIKNKDNIQTIINSKKELCNIYQEYYSYIEGIYKNYKNDCCKGKNRNCPPDDLKFNEWCNENQPLTKLTCTGSQNDAKPLVQSGNDNAPQSGVEYGTLAKQGTGEQDRRGKRGGREDGFSEAETRSTRPQEEHGQSGSSGLEGETRAVVRAPSELSPGSGSLTDSDNLVAGFIGEGSETILPKNVGTIGATLAGSSLFLLMMYKYTPMGSWIYTRVLGKNKLMENMRNNNYESLVNGVEDREVSLNDTMYNIRYNSSSNQ